MSDLSPQESTTLPGLADALQQHVRGLFEIDREERLLHHRLLKEDFVRRLQEAAHAVEKVLQQLGDTDADPLKTLLESLGKAAAHANALDTKLNQLKEEINHLQRDLPEAAKSVRQFQVLAEEIKVRLEHLTQAQNQHTQATQGVTGRVFLGALLGSGIAALGGVFLLYFLQVHGH